MYSKVSIGKICLPTVQRDPRLAPDTYFEYIDISSIDREKKIIATTSTILGKDAPSRARKSVQSGDVLVSTVRPNLNAVAIVPRELDGHIASTGFCVLRSDSKILDSHYLYYRTLTPEFIEYLTARMRGANYPAVTDGVVKDTSIPLPPLSEQRRIVEILNQADALRKKRAEADAKAERILLALFYKMFGDPATNPRGWEIVSIEKITSLVTSGLTPRGGEANYVTEGPYFLRSQNIQMNNLDLTDIACLPIEIHESMSRTKLKYGDVLLNITGASIGRVAWYDIPDHEANVNQHVCIIRLTDEAWPEYVSFILSTAYGQTLIDRAQTGATRQGLNHENVRGIKIPLPSPEYQQKFSLLFRSFKQINAYKTMAQQNIDLLYRTLLHRAFSGNLTAKWREAHTKELLAEMEEQEKFLNKVPSTLSIERNLK